MKCKVEFVKMSESEEGKERKERKGKGGEEEQGESLLPSLNRDEERGWKDACRKLTSQGGSPCAVIGFSPASQPSVRESGMF